MAATDATCETCPHYLTLTDEDLDTLGTRAKCAPPLRSGTERDRLWEAIGDIALIASDHSPCPPEMKQGEFAEAWGGIAGCQTLLPLLLDSGRLTLDEVSTLTSTSPARRFRLPKAFAVGGDADLVLVDLDEPPRARAPRPPPTEPVRGPPAARQSRPHAPARRDRLPRRRDHPATRAPADTDQGRHMSDLRITAGPYAFAADWVADAPKTRAAFEAMLPFRNKIIHVRWSGESAWIPLGDLETNLPFENHTSHPAPGEILLYPGGFSETEILFPYGGTCFSSIVGQLAGNHFLTISEGREQLRDLGRLVLWEGAQDVVFEPVH